MHGEGTCRHACCCDINKRNPRVAAERGAVLQSSSCSVGAAEASGPIGYCSMVMLHNVANAHLVQARKFEASGLSREQAEALTEHITTQVVLDRIRLSEKFVHKVDLEKVRIVTDRVRWQWGKQKSSRSSDRHSVLGGPTAGLIGASRVWASRGRDRQLVERNKFELPACLTRRKMTGSMPGGPLCTAEHTHTHTRFAGGCCHADGSSCRTLTVLYCVLARAFVGFDRAGGTRRQLQGRAASEARGTFGGLRHSGYWKRCYGI